MTQVQLQQLQKQLWNIANTLRGKMGADEFRDYILGFIFFKYLSEKSINFANQLLQDEEADFTYTELDKNNAEHIPYITEIKKLAIAEVGYALLPDQLFHTLAQRGRQGEFILDDLSATLKAIEQSTLGSDSADDFANLFEDLDLNSTKLGNSASDRNELVAKVLSHLDDIDFDISNTESDVLGDAYEYLIGEFASGAGKKAGEFYTPQTVSTLLAKIVTQGKERLRSVYDPTCGSGSLLLRVKREVQDVDMIYGQEMNRTTYNLARMNMILHDVHFAKFDIKQEDTLIRPQHIDKRFDAVVANPPFSANWSADPLFLQDERFSNFGKLAPSSKADMAFVQHMLYQLDHNGTMAVVLPHGVLFRGSSEGVIRKYLIEQLNVIDTIIGLPANIFYGTSIPTCILVLKKNREHTGNILFIDASNDFEKQKNQNKLLPQHLDNIIGAFENRQDIEKYAKVATLQEVKDNDYNLNIPRYVDTFEAEAEIDLDAIAKQLQALEQDSQVTDQVIADFCQKLGIDSPFTEAK
ncbi:type I restriction-modification system subunit M [Acinetobacter gerneri]|uniref:site-specific DNA-methyltransferase (adenine-specific) n=1 Tax=Acinetobacter gerneri TaxID=202952 RepID=A0AAW8JFM9_9GAMM|nr:type I restriction-modification system subunit M [Acinetobacter gerneri]MDQ9009743.1 type I restriction-modification system subunit M [Acinetobacter gerneri]MDQ9013715.1 type I restriction-modification system subunit M [Acinetobacter gerneri]MDQ9025129.1 type I restriction-modification system subunit M [Acinetobacter gerneri]MDQ9050892.1 type I restriction-modification system subunit M [Acinetobacter gerneri]MDQ9059756.1 type I restriction-modification system subunit M [Acinetobacter gerner